MKILVLNGPNLNFLGIREPLIYGTRSYEDLVKRIEEHAEACGVSVQCMQTNHEGVLVDEIQRAYRELEQEGCVCSIPGKGSFVSDSTDAAAQRRRELVEQMKKISEELKHLGVSEEEQVHFLKGGTNND